MLFMELEGSDIMESNGALKSVGSTGVYDIEKIISVKEEDLPEEFIIKNKPKVLDQKTVSSCVAHAICECLSANLLRDKKDSSDLSVLMVYGLWRKHKGEGMFPETTINLGRSIGTSLRRIAPGNFEVPDAIKKAEEYKEKYPKSLGFKVGSYFKVKKNEDFAKNIKRTLYEFNLPLMMIWDYGSLGRHAEIVIGWTKDNMALCQNSWGEEFGEKGLHEVDFKYLSEVYLIFMDKFSLPFSDVEGHWAEKYIRNGYFSGIFDGKTETTFEPEGTIKRGEMAKIIDTLVKKYDEKIFLLEEELRKK